MKIEETKVKIETSNEFEKKQFKIGDVGLLFDILRSKMYSNPIQTVAREISSNALDSHIEAGIPNTPVEISLPSKSDPLLKIKDFGMGISPENIENVYISFGTSTKRDSNELIGAYGIGSKSVFALADTFNVVTIFNKVKYTYSCFIDETKVGDCVLLSKVDIDAHNGTEIIIPIKLNDIGTVISAVEHVTRHWKVKPTIKNGSLTYQKISKLVEGKNWFLAQNSDNSWNRHSKVKVLVGVIEYPLDSVELAKYADTSLLNSTFNDFYLQFNIGELSLSASREQIYLNDATKTKIKERIDLIKKEIKEIYQVKIDKYEDLYQANVYYKTLFKDFTNIKYLGQLNYKGMPLSHDYVETKAQVYTFGKRTGFLGTKYFRRNGQSISFLPNQDLYFNDLPIKQPTAKHVESAFTANPKLESIQIVCELDKVKKADLDKSINFESMKPKLLSTIAAPPKKGFTEKLNIFMVNSYGALKQVPYSDFEADTKDKYLGFYQSNVNTGFKKSGKLKVPDFNKPVKDKVGTFEEKEVFYEIASLAAIYDASVSLYFLKETTNKRIMEFAEEFSPIEDFITSKVDITKDDATKSKYVLNYFDYNNYDLITLVKSDISEKIKNSLAIMKAVKVNKNASSYFYELYHGVITNADINAWLVKNPEFDFKKLREDFYSTYPMIKAVGYDFRSNIQHINKYISLMDKELAEKAKK